MLFIYFRSARGNTSLDSTLRLTSQLKKDISEFEEKLDKINERISHQSNTKERESALRQVQLYMQDLLDRIEEAIPLITLAITTSGANLSSRMPNTVSPGRLLQAGRFLSDADSKYESLIEQLKYTENANQPVYVQVGPSFTLILYTIFHAQSNHISWKEEFRRCKIRLWRVNDLGAKVMRRRETDNEGHLKQETDEDEEEDDFEYRYVMTIDESFRDDRYHDNDERPRCRVLDVATVTRLFFSASGKLLQIDESRSPVLVLKLNSVFDTHLAYGESIHKNDENDSNGDTSEESDPEDHSLLYEQNHQHLANNTEAVEWLAFEQYYTSELTEGLYGMPNTPGNDDDYDEEDQEEQDNSGTDSGTSDEDVDINSHSIQPNSSGALSQQLEALSLSPPIPSQGSGRLNTSTPKEYISRPESQNKENPRPPRGFVPPAAVSPNKFKKQFSKEKASLSLLECLIRLIALQSNDQESVYNTQDERIVLYLSDETSGQNANARSSAPSSTTRSNMETSPVAAETSEHELPHHMNRRSRRRSNMTPTGTHSLNNSRVSGIGSSGGRYGPSTSSQFAKSLRGDSSSNPQTPQKDVQREGQMKPEGASAGALTPWEKDRLHTRRQVLLMRKELEDGQYGGGVTGSIYDSPTSHRKAAMMMGSKYGNRGVSPEKIAVKNNLLRASSQVKVKQGSGKQSTKSQQVPPPPPPSIPSTRSSSSRTKLEGKEEKDLATEREGEGGGSGRRRSQRIINQIGGGSIDTANNNRNPPLQAGLIRKQDIATMRTRSGGNQYGSSNQSNLRGYNQGGEVDEDDDDDDDEGDEYFDSPLNYKYNNNSNKGI